MKTPLNHSPPMVIFVIFSIKSISRRPFFPATPPVDKRWRHNSRLRRHEFSYWLCALKCGMDDEHDCRSGANGEKITSRLRIHFSVRMHGFDFISRDFKRADSTASCVCSGEEKGGIQGGSSFRTACEKKIHTHTITTLLLPQKNTIILGV